MTPASGSDIGEELRTAFGRDRVLEHAPLAPWTTFKVGGPADYLLLARSNDDVLTAARLAAGACVPLTVLGGGSNVLVSDAGVRGLVVCVRSSTISLLPPGRVRADAGVTINGLVRWTITHGLAGLEEWAGTPGTVGGAIFGNAHFRGRDIGDLVDRVLLAGGGRIQEVMSADMEFAYDYSRLHRTREVVLAADFRVRPGDPEILRQAARASLAYRKCTQPLALPSAGCIFQNPDPSRDRLPDDMPWSAGALVDRAGLKGAVHGGARVSPTHGNFIVNEGQATAGDVRALIERCREEVRARFGVMLRDEIVCLGFERAPGLEAAGGED